MFKFKTYSGLFGAEIWYTNSERLLNGNSISTNHACMHVPNKIGQKVKKFILGSFFRKILQMINKSGNKSLF